MKKEIVWYHITYPDDSSQTHIVEDSSCIVQFFYNNGKKDYPYFESEAYHLLSWCKENGFDYKSGKLEIKIPIKT